MKKIELEIKEILNKVSSETSLVVLLREKGGPRTLPIMVGLLEAQSIAITMYEMKMPRPGVYDLMINTTEILGAHIKEVRIYKIVGGVFYSYLILDKEGEEISVDSRTSDALALAMRAGAPIYIGEDLLEKNCMKEDSKGYFSMSISAVSIEVLREALDKAVENENYEFAAKLRDEIKKRSNELK
jgi:uncharacterized protein